MTRSLPDTAAPATAAAAASPRWLRVPRRWWPATIGLALGVYFAVDLRNSTAAQWPFVALPVVALPVVALVYLGFGAARGMLRRHGVLSQQIAGVLGFGALALVALVVDPNLGRYVVAAGWLGHALWDVAHHRDLSHHRGVGVVPRGYAEACIVLDLLIGAAVLAAPSP